MTARALEGGLAEPATDAARIFRAALGAMARPGTIHRVTGVEPPAPLSAAAGALLLTLADHETALWLAPSVEQRDVRDWLAFHTQASIGPRAEARFAVGRWEELLPLDAYAQGTPEYPDRSATLIVETDGLEGTARLTGPGIAGEARLAVPDAEALAANRARFPLGLDFFLCADDRLAALPRTTRVEG